jgi:vacuolar-type H+-ATPase subunit H
LPEKVTDAAEPPATRILQQLFKEVEKEISDALSEHQNPLDEVAEAILSSQKKFLERSDAQRRRRVLLDLETIFAHAPSFASAELLAER